MQQVLVIARSGQIEQLATQAQSDRRQRLELARFQRKNHVIPVAEHAALAFGADLGLGQVVAPQHDVLRRYRDRRAVGGRQDVVRRHHQHGGFDLSLRRQRDVHRHLVAVEIGVECRAHERMDPNGLAFDQHRLERLNPEPMERGCPIQQDRMLPNHLFQHVPDFFLLLLDHLLGLLDRRDELALLELVVDERLEQLERHFLGQPTLMQFQLGADDDHGPARVIDALAEQVLPEPTLLALQRVGQRLQGAIVGAAEDAPTTAVVEQGVDRLLEHPLFVADDDVGRLQLHEFLQPIIAVDHPTVQVVQVRRGEAAAIERHQRPQLRWNDRHDVQNHPLGLVRRSAERIDDPEPLGELQLLLDGRLPAHALAHVLGELVDADPLQQLLDRLGPHLRSELDAVLLAGLPILIFGEQLILLEPRLTGVDDDIGLEVENALQIAQRDVQQVADPARQPLEEPDVADRRRQRNMPEPLAANLRLRHLDAALVTDHPAVLHALVLAAQALPVGDRTEDLGAEQPVALRLERPVVDRLGLGDLTVRPRPDALW